ncbi:MAG: TIGR03663 family protein, partial [Chloroflexi bacterium]|nr:TIGR03663 family protein [Chloroflexota bacterium]
RGYEHSPLLHGPFQFFGTALTFFLSGGASDYTVRILPALFGVALIVLPFFFRDRLGRVGALLASGLIAFSPTLLYFSRFARNDIYVAVFTLGIVICLWRYVDERKPLFLYLGAALLGLSFATKENTFINVAVLLVFLNLWLAAGLARQSNRRLGLGRMSSSVAYLFLYLPWAWAITALWPIIGGIRRRLGLRERHPAADFLIVLGTLSLPQFAAGIQLPLESVGYELDTLGREQMVGISTVLALLAATAVVGLGWNWRVWLLAAAAFYIPYALLYTSFLTNTGGFGSGIWESLDYWLGEQQLDQPRGNQPDFYYVMLLPAYEFLALAFAGPALLYFSLRGGPRSWLLTAIATLSLLAFFGADSFSATLGDITQPLALPVAAVAIYFAVRGSPFERFLVFWTAAAIVGYSWVGEKMPWLSVHTTLPVVILAAYSLGRLFERMPSPAGLLRYAPALLPFVAGVLGMAAISFAAFGPLDSGAPRLALVAAALALLLALLPPLGRRRLAVVAAAAVFGGLALFSVRTAVIASFEHGDVPNELLVYTQTSPEVPDVMERIAETAQTSGRGLDLPVIVDDTYTWPWAWYLRDYSITYESFDDEFEPPPDAVLLIARENESKLAPFLDRYQEPVPYRLRWWFPEVYRSIGRDNLWLAMRDFGENLARSDTWETWWRYLRYREHPQGTEAVYDASVWSIAYFPLIYDSSAGADIEGRLIIGRSGDAPGALADPSGVAVDGEGNIYVLDSGNARIQKFAPDGRLLKTMGDAGSGEGQFNQPADLAIDAEGNVYVIDTWNHRVQKFDADLTFITAWGGPTNDLVNPGDYEMWGPRSIAVDSEGNVWVVDTGTQRVRKFSPDGELLGTVGERGRGLGQFREPVGIAFDPVTGDFLVADVGNARIQRFDSEMRAIAAYPIDEWKDLNPANKPYLAALPDGRILVSDPVRGRILLLDQAGGVIAALSSVSGEALAFPRGIAYDADGGFVITSEGAAGRVRRFPLSDFALR